MNIFPKKQSGYTLLFATLTAALVLGVVVFIVGTTRKQYILSSTTRDSVYSFYATQSAMECVGSVHNLFSPYDNSSTTDEVTQITSHPYVFSCANNQYGGNPITLSYVATTTFPSEVGAGSNPVYSMSFSLGFAEVGKDLTRNTNLWGCASVIVYFYIDHTKNTENAYVISRGYNLCQYQSSASIDARYIPNYSSPRTVERALWWVSSLPE